MKKTLMIVLVIVLVLSFSSVALAEDDGSITIASAFDQTITDSNYQAYKILDLEYGIDSYLYSIDESSAWYPTVKAYADLDKGLTMVKSAETGSTEWIVSFTQGTFSAADFAQYIRGEGETFTPPTGATAIEFSEHKATGLAYGYYFVNSNLGAVCALTNTDPDATIYDKNATPPLTKKHNPETSFDGSVEVGQKVTYISTTRIPSLTGYTDFGFKLADSMTSGLTYNGDVTVKVGTATSGDWEVANTATGFTVWIPLFNENGTAKYAAGTVVTLEYSATVNDKAIKRDSEINTIALFYSNNPVLATGCVDAFEDITTPESEIPTGADKKTESVTDKTVNILIDKYIKDTNPEAKLGGAKFVLQNKTGNKYYKYDSVNKKVTWVETKSAAELVTTGEGAAKIEGLKSGNYTLIETDAPLGYNLAQPIDVKIVKEGDNLNVYFGTSTTPAVIQKYTSYEDSNYNDIPFATVRVANAKGQILPETGGIGTTIFYVIGGVAIAVAIIILVSRKRMKNAR